MPDSSSLTLFLVASLVLPVVPVPAYLIYLGVRTWRARSRFPAARRVVVAAVYVGLGLAAAFTHPRP